MSYNLKNKTVALIAVSLALVFATNHVSYAEDAGVENQLQSEVQQPAIDDVLELDLEVNNETPAEVTAQEADSNTDDEFFNQDEALDPAVENTEVKADTVDAATENPETTDAAVQSLETDDDLFGEGVEGILEVNPETANNDTGDVAAPATEPENIPEAEAPKSPFEKFGNAILSKVDNDLFNQMSNIEKQNTLLNLEIKREELKNKVEALRAARARAREEELARKQAEEEKLKDAEAQRKAMILIEQQKLKEMEIELEKTRQAKVLNEYMNEMLRMNQEWIAKNAELQGRIHDLEQERIELIKEFEGKMTRVSGETSALGKKADAAIAAHQRIVTSLNSQITQLRRTITETEDRIRQMEDGADNPFATELTEDAIDMSQEYAIMDITGQGDDIVAKIVSQDGTTFIVHKGSMLKGGEVVTSITDHYVAFDKKGIKSYLYTGGTVMEFEPVKSFNNSDKMPENTVKTPVKAEVKNVLGSTAKNAATPTNSAKVQNNERREARPARSKTSKGKSAGSVSFGSGMFVQ